MTFGKVLSPQYFIWTLPALALVAARDKWGGGHRRLTLLLTQVEFPALYWRLLDMRADTVAVVVARNTLLLALFLVTCGGCGGWRSGAERHPVRLTHPAGRP